MEEKSKGTLLMEELAYKKKNAYEEASETLRKEIFDYSEGYKAFLDAAKTERESVKEAIRMAQAAGFTEYNFGDTLSVGDKKYYNVHGKSVALFTVGKADLAKNGIRILASHIDSPRLDLKQVPLYEDNGMAFLKTHYYGGIKKYQWTAIPLALHGVVALKNGTTVEISVGEEETDPVFYINDLLPHLGRDQMSQTGAKIITGEDLNVVVGGLPYADEKVKEKIKLTVLAKLNELYGMTETDFLSAELSAVPAFKAKDVGFDRALIAAYGHDDRVCSYPALTAILESTGNRTSLVVLADKEEIGSEGNTGMQCQVYVDLMQKIAEAKGADFAAVRENSKCLSADVTACYDPNFASVYEKSNSAILSCGTTICKFTGSGGKGGSNDASAEFLGFVRNLFEENGIVYQTAELGKIDAGGGGTVAKYIAKLNIDTVDIGVPVISMHAPYEMVSKADVYATYQAFAAFIKD
ncbi:MAG: aminopeptidase [Clostridia bacterium]|nr:aminopeptidase [Clostridia bacterium]